MQRTIPIVIAYALQLAAFTPAVPAPALLVHEWGTFTSFQDDDGARISGVNVDDEAALSTLIERFSSCVPAERTAPHASSTPSG